MNYYRNKYPAQARYVSTEIDPDDLPFKIRLYGTEKYKLGDIAKIEISGVDKKSVDGETPVRLCNFVDVYRNWAITQKLSENFMIASAKETEIAKCSIHKGQVAITKDSETRDDIGIPAYIADDFDNVLLGYHCALITPNDDVLDGKYLNAFMHTRYIQKYFENNASGSGQRYTLSNETIFQIPILLPSLEVQKLLEICYPISTAK